MKKALILVDIQNDFLPGSALAVPDGDAVVPVANRAMGRYDLVVATQDWHPADHGSFASQHAGRKPGDVIDLHGLQQVLWPDHCVVETRGAAFAPGLDTGRIHEVIRKGTDPNVDSYSGFFDNGHRHATGLADMLRRREIDELAIMGLATDYCVKFTALDARALGFKTRLILPGVRGVEIHAGDCRRAIDDMRTAGVEVVDLES